MATHPSLFSGPYRLVSWSVCALVSLYAFEEMGVVAALPTAVGKLGGLAYFGWVYTGFLAASVIGMVYSAHVCDQYGPRVPALAASTLFVAGLTLAGTATQMAPLVAGRVIQGVAGGGLMTAVYVIIGTFVPEAIRPRLFAVVSFCWVVPGVIGPTAAGAITEHVGWRWVFLGLVPLTIAAAAPLVVALPSAVGVTRQTDVGRKPWPARVAAPRIWSAVVAAAGIAAIQAGAERATASSAAVVACGAAAVVWALRGLLPRGTVLARSAVGSPVALRAITAGALFGVESVIPLMMATQHGLGPLQASIPLACAGLPCAISSWWVGRLGGEDAVDRRTSLARLGFGLLCVADASFIWLSRPATPSWLMSPAWVLAGFGIGLVVPTANVLVLARTTDANRSADASALQIASTTASCVTTGFAGVLVGSASRGSLGYTTAFGIIGVSMAAVALLGVLAAGRLRLDVSRSGNNYVRSETEIQSATGAVNARDDR
ncbi:MAG TPA: MFS transporter [Acidothermaceae bacterium]|nr:MFS transporter [Acidothermaceae bacterium]